MPDSLAGSDAPRCRSCSSGGLTPFLSLGTTPLADSLVDPSNAAAPEPRYPLDVAFCPECSLVQILEEVAPEELFGADYRYFSSYSPRLLEHSRQNAHRLVAKAGLGPRSLVVELASNDGYMLRNFTDQGIPVLGVEPAPAPAAAARAAGIPTVSEFFGIDMARDLRSRGMAADVIIANNVMAHVPDLNGFVGGMAELLADDGIISVENPYVRDLVDRCEFDTIYHEHFCYFSTHAVDRLMRRHGLFLNDVTYFHDLHGGTLRWEMSRREGYSRAAREILEDERRRGLTQGGYYTGFADRVRRLARDLTTLLQDLRDGGHTIAGYGAAAKGSTLVNYAGIGPDLVEFVVDRNPHKQGLLMPGVHIPILAPGALLDRRPDYLLLLAWNFRSEIAAQQSEYLAGGGRMIVPVPDPAILEAEESHVA